MKKIMTLCLVYQHPRILLGMKKRGFGAHRWNGFGGKVQENESIEEAALRETKEEAGITLHSIEKVGILQFEFQNTQDVIEMHTFRAEDYSGEESESPEMYPRWFLLHEIPFADMWSSDVYWFPLFLKKKKFRGKFLFDENDRVVRRNVEVVKELP